MTPIEKAAKAMRYSEGGFEELFRAGITAFIDAALADPEALERIAKATDRHIAVDAIEALKHEATR